MNKFKKINKIEEKITYNSEIKKYEKKVKTYINRLKIINYFIHTKTKPEWMTIKYLPVLPPNIRPIVKLQDKTIITTDLNFIYGKIIETNNKIVKLRKMSVPEKFLHSEKSFLQETIDKLIDNNQKITNRTNVRFLS